MGIQIGKVPTMKFDREPPWGSVIDLEVRVYDPTRVLPAADADVLVYRIHYSRWEWTTFRKGLFMVGGGEPGLLVEHISAWCYLPQPADHPFPSSLYDDGYYCRKRWKSNEGAGWQLRGDENV